MISSLSVAAPVPTSEKEIFKLVVFDNGSKMISTPADGQVSIIDWYLSTVSSEGNQDLAENGVLYSRIMGAECTEHDTEVTCSVSMNSQEFVPSLEMSDLYCTGADYGEGIKVVFSKEDSKLNFLRGEINVSMSGNGPCGADLD